MLFKLAWSILGARRFKFVQMKCPGSQMAPHIVICREMLKKSSDEESLGQFQPNLAGNMLGGWGFRFVQIKGLVPLGPIRGKIRKILINLQKSHEPLAGMH